MRDNGSKMTPKKAAILSWGAAFYGLLFAGIGFYDWGDEQSAFLAISGCIMIAGGCAGIYYTRRKKAEYNADKLNHLLYELIKEQNGKITVLDFAMKANINPAQARELIEAKSIELAAITEIREEGTVYYVFR